jgi:hypothetical protein
MRKILERCPSCGGDLLVTRLSCPSCGTVILGQYEPCPFCALSPEDIQFVQTFIQCRGNVREMERELGISYWTVRRMLDDVIERLGLEPGPVSEEDATTQMQEILEQLDRGEISAAEANEALSRLKRAGPHT